ncbi:hypothetical protein MMPV_004086 [Pyropia vietnamensis]
MLPAISVPLPRDVSLRPSRGASPLRSPPPPPATGGPPPGLGRLLPRPAVRSLDGATTAALRSTLSVPTYAAAVELLARLVIAAGATDVVIVAHPHALAVTVRHRGGRGGDNGGGGGGGGHDLLLHSNDGSGLADLAEVAEVTLTPAPASSGRPATPLRLRPTVAGLTAVPTPAVPDDCSPGGGGGGHELAGRDAAAATATISVRRLFARVPVRRRLTVTSPVGSAMVDARRRLLPLAAAHPCSRLCLTDAASVVWLDVPPATAAAVGAHREAATAASAGVGGASPDRVAALFGPATAQQMVPLRTVAAAGGVSVRGAASTVAVGGIGGPVAADVQVLLLGGVPATVGGAAVASAVAAWRRHAPYPPRAVVGGRAATECPLAAAAAAARRRPRPTRPPRLAAGADASTGTDADSGAAPGDPVEALLAAVAAALDTAFVAFFRRCPSPLATPSTDGVGVDAPIGKRPRQARLGLRAAKRRRIGVEVLVADPLGGGHKDPAPTWPKGGAAAAFGTTPPGGSFAADLIPRRSLACGSDATGVHTSAVAAATAVAQCRPLGASSASRLTHRSAAEIRAAQAASSRLWTVPQPVGCGRRVQVAGAGRGGDGGSRSGAGGAGEYGMALPLPTDGAWSASVPLRVSVGQLRRARLLGTAASAVLLLVIDGVVVAVDQHAADERVRFEALRGVAAAQLRDAGGGAGGAMPLPTAALRVPAALHLGAADVAALGGRIAEAAALGWKLERVPTTSPKRRGAAGRGDANTAGEWTLTGVPVVAGVPVVGAAAFRSWLASPPLRLPPLMPAASRMRAGEGKEVDADVDAGGAPLPPPPLAVVLPPPFIAALAARACHTAVRFGDVLPRAAAAALLRRLAAAANPFVCAHGRPAVVPLAVLGGRVGGGGEGTAGASGLTVATVAPGIPPWAYR